MIMLAGGFQDMMLIGKKRDRERGRGKEDDKMGENNSNDKEAVNEIKR